MPKFKINEFSTLDIDDQKIILYNILESLNLGQNHKLEKLIYFLFSLDENKKLNLEGINSKDIYNLLEALKGDKWRVKIMKEHVQISFNKIQEFKGS